LESLEPFAKSVQKDFQGIDKKLQTWWMFYFFSMEPFPQIAVHD